MSVIFGDFDSDDAFNPARADPEQVARKLHDLRRSDGRERKDWHRLRQRDRDALIAEVVLLLAWMRRQGTTP